MHTHVRASTRAPPRVLCLQWLTRLYYMAHTPYQITWALDSNVVSCTPGAAARFLEGAMATRLWGFHIVHASQNYNTSWPMCT